MRAKISILIACIVVIKFDVSYATKTPFLRMCYYPSYGRHRNTIAMFELTHIDFSLCTHYIYAYARIDNLTMLLEPEAPSIEEGSNGLFQRFMAGKSNHSTLKTLLAFGGPEINAHYGLVAIGQSETRMDAFVTSAVSLATRKGFDGLVLDWQAPDSFDTRDITVRLMEKLRAESGKVNSPNLLLVVGIQDSKPQLDMKTTISQLLTSVDYIVIKAYDYPRNGMTYALFNSPLYARLKNSPYDMYCVNFSVNYWNGAGIPYGKMVVGMTGVGRILELANASQVEPGSPITKKIEYGHYYHIQSGLAYPEVCVLKESSLAFFDDIQKNPYLVRGQTWIGYEDKKSLGLKIQWFQQLGVAGITFAGLDEDDFTGTMCKEGKYPLLSHIKAILEPGSAAISSTTQSTQEPKGKDDDDSGVLSDNTSSRLIVVIATIVLFILGYAIGHVLVVNRKGQVQEVVVQAAVERPEKGHSDLNAEKKLKRPRKPKDGTTEAAALPAETEN